LSVVIYYYTVAALIHRRPKLSAVHSLRHALEQWKQLRHTLFADEICHSLVVMQNLLYVSSFFFG